MRTLIGLALACLIAGAAHAAPETAIPANPPAEPPGAPAAVADAGALDRLFDQLKTEDDATEARRLEAEIWKRWMDSGDAEINMLMRWTIAAMNIRSFALALNYLDTIIVTKPDYAEGWNKRATVHWLMRNYDKSLADIERTLALEPRHWGALTGRGMIMRDLGEYEKAVEALRAALAIDPNLEDVRVGLRVLEDRLGKGI